MHQLRYKTGKTGPDQRRTTTDLILWNYHTDTVFAEHFHRIKCRLNNSSIEHTADEEPDRCTDFAFRLDNIRHTFKERSFLSFDRAASIFNKPGKCFVGRKRQATLCSFRSKFLHSLSRSLNSLWADLHTFVAGRTGKEPFGNCFLNTVTTIPRIKVQPLFLPHDGRSGILGCRKCGTRGYTAVTLNTLTKRFDRFDSIVCYPATAGNLLYPWVQPSHLCHHRCNIGDKIPDAGEGKRLYQISVMCFFHACEHRLSVNTDCT